MNSNFTSQSITEIHLNKIKNRIFNLSPIVSQGYDRECSKNDFTREDNNLFDYGCLGKLWRVNHKKTDEVFGIRVMQKDRIIKSGQYTIDNINHVIRLMYKVRHPNVIMLINHFEDDENLYLIFQDVKLDKSNLANQLIKIPDENKLLSIMKQIIFVLIYLNSLDTPIINRDLRPEYILLDEKFEVVKITDYAWSDLVKSYRMSNMHEKNFNIYTAPEIINKWEITEKVDVWNLGVLFYEILTGETAFKGKTSEELKDKILNCKIQWSTAKFRSEMSKNLVKSMLKINPEERPSLNDVLNNIIFQNPNVILPSIYNKQFEDEEFIINKKILHKKVSIKHNDPINEKLRYENEHLKSEIQKLREEYAELEKENLSLKSKPEKNEQESKFKEDNNLEFDEHDNCVSNIDDGNLNQTESFEKLAELEERSQEFLEYRSKIRLLEYESELLKIDFEEANRKNEEYEAVIKNLNILLDEEQNEKNSRIESLNSKIEMLENSIFKNCNDTKNSETNFEDFFKNISVIISNLLKEFNELLIRLIKKNRETNENLFKSYKEFLNEKEDNIKELILKTKESLDNEMRTKSLKFSNTSGPTNNEKIDWMQKQINELMPYKMKSLTLKESNDKFEDKNKILTEKINAMEVEIKTLKSIISLKEDTLNNLRQYVTNIEDKLSDTKDFIMRRCPEKVEEFFRIYDLKI
jgi:serine/threonine protein kinase